jgi:hypothetical protein
MRRRRREQKSVCLKKEKAGERKRRLLCTRIYTVRSVTVHFFLAVLKFYGSGGNFLSAGNRRIDTFKAVSIIAVC